MHRSILYQRVVYVVMLPLLIFQIGCLNYYKANRITTTENPSKILALQSESRFFILRNGSRVLYMTNLSLSDDQKTLQCRLDSLPKDHNLHLNLGHKKGNLQYKKNTTEQFVLNEVHMYIPEDSIARPGQMYTLALDKVQKMEVIERDGKRSTNSYVIGALGYTIGAMAVAAIIIAATKSSCPFVSVNTGNEFVLQGEIYGGAIYPQMARDDYMPLQMNPAADGNFQVKISNELQEKQYTDFADLLVITHDKNAKVLSDEKGNLYQVNNCEQPLTAYTSDHVDALAAIEKAGDNRLLDFDDTLTSNANNNNIVIRFKKPGKCTKSKTCSVNKKYLLAGLFIW